MYEKFINRENELDFLRKAYDSERAELIIIYGRRRIGKTELAKKSVEDRMHIYFFAEETLNEKNLQDFRKIVAKYLGNPLIEKSVLNWEEVFALIKNENVVIIIDEFPNMIKENKAILSKFQKIWDEILSKSQVKLILLGSSISIMESQVLGYRSPLYGRRTGQIHLKPLSFIHLRDFFPNKSLEDIVKIYGLTDGIPAYIKEVHYRFKLGEKLDNVFLPNKPLFEEAEHLLRYEIREPVRYFQILKAIAFGYTKFGEIVNFTSFPNSTVSQYLSNLETLHIVREEYPITESKKRNTRYYLCDNYFNFYFRFIYPNKSLLIGGDTIPNFENKYNRYLGIIFEKVGREFLVELNKRGLLPFRFQEIGRWWKKGEEIDIVALNRNERNVLFIEVKWKDLKSKDAYDILRKLKKKSELLSLKNYSKYFGIIARKIENKKKMGEHYLVLDLEDIEKLR